MTTLRLPQNEGKLPGDIPDERILRNMGVEVGPDGSLIYKGKSTEKWYPNETMGEALGGTGGSPITVDPLAAYASHDWDFALVKCLKCGVLRGQTNSYQMCSGSPQTGNAP